MGTIKKQITVEEAIDVLQKWQHKRPSRRSIVVIYGESEDGSIYGLDTVNLLTEGDMPSWQALMRKAMKLHPDFSFANKQAVLGLTEPQLQRVYDALCGE